MHHILLDITSTLPCGCILASIPLLADVRSGSRTKQLSSRFSWPLWKACSCIAVSSPSITFLPRGDSSTKSSLCPLPPQSTYLGDIDYVCDWPDCFHVGQRASIILLKQAHRNLFDGEGQPRKRLFQVRSHGQKIFCIYSRTVARPR